jgi:hypothetical protein
MGDNEHSAPGDNTALAEDSSIPQCCCGRADCAFLAHSCNVLDAVQRDARTAGELGQVRYPFRYVTVLYPPPAPGVYLEIRAANDTGKKEIPMK